MASPIKYSSRTFNSIMNDFNNNTQLADKPHFFKTMIAGIGDLLSMIENGSANQAYLDTAFTRRAASNLLELIDYDLSFQTTSTGTCIFHLNPATAFPATFTAAELTGNSQGTIAISAKQFEARSGETIAADSGTFTAAVTDIVTVASDFEYTGHKVRLTTTGTLPAGLALLTDYYVIYTNATTIEFASSVANAFLGTAVNITGVGAGVHTWTSLSFSKIMYQQETKAQQTIGESDGITTWQEFNLPDTLVLSDTLVITVGANPYTKISIWVDQTALLEVFKMRPLSDDQSRVIFGNGTYGLVPPNNTIYADYAVGGGADSNITVLNRITTYSGGSSDITSITNPTTFTGGADEESIDSGKRLGPLLLKARNRAITTGDFESLTLATGGMSLVQANKNAFGLGSVQLVAIASGGGNPSLTKRNAVVAELVDKTILEEVDITFSVATLTTENTTIAVKVLTGYVYATILPYITQAIKLFWSESGQEVVDKYASDTLTNTITLINTIFSTAFTEAADGIQISQMLDGLTTIGARNFGDDIQESDFVVFIQGYVSGIDYMTITLPAFPIALDDDEITTHSGATIILTEIP